MFGKKYTIVILLSFVCIFAGIIKVNIEYNRLNGKAYDEAIYQNIYPDDRSKSDAFGEFVLSRKNGIRVRMYFTKSPFDLRFSIGNKVIYVNSSIFKGQQESSASIRN
ncbi:hypothetical protein [Clostridium thermarum]|uniref:hypothetical protein n=1 Tax=Clostridium thermarum TaxID=1716543 RepID=UPI0013D1FEC5|nr:hypothetical protein [Clostridium thermarum]